MLATADRSYLVYPRLCNIVHTPGINYSELHAGKCDFPAVAVPLGQLDGLRRVPNPGPSA